MLYAKFAKDEEKRLIGWFNTYSKLDVMIIHKIQKVDESEIKEIFESNVAWARFGEDMIFSIFGD